MSLRKVVSETVISDQLPVADCQRTLIIEN
jgi:hypothetical protein